MSLRVQTHLDSTRTESTSKLYAHSSSVERVAKIEQDAEVEKLWKEGKSKEGSNKLDIEAAVESINDTMEHINRSLRFSIHEDTQRMIVRVVNTSTDEVIKELPPEDVLDTVARIREMIGLLIDERA